MTVSTPGGESMTVSTPLLEVQDLSVTFRTRRFLRRDVVRAVNGVSFQIGRGETLGLVGESGSGKSTIGRVLLRLVTPESGTATLDGEDIIGTTGARLHAQRLRIQAVFQDPYSSLNPRLTATQTIEEPLRVHRRQLSTTQRHKRTRELLHQVGLANHHLQRRPLELSGGQRQRLAIARALAMEPDLLICDEPVSALDVSTQSQIINLLERLQSELGVSYLFVAHDLAVVHHTSHHIAVMYRGEIVENGPADRIYRDPAHPYTARLLAAVPMADPEHQARTREQRRRLTVAAPSTDVETPACVFARRCPFVMPQCIDQRPPTRTVAGGGTVNCHLYPHDDAVPMAVHSSPATSVH